MVEDQLRDLPPMLPAEYDARVRVMTQARSRAPFWGFIAACEALGCVLLLWVLTQIPLSWDSAALVALALGLGGMAFWMARLARGPQARLWRRFERIRQLNRPMRLEELRAAAQEFQTTSLERPTRRTSAST